MSDEMCDLIMEVEDELEVGNEEYILPDVNYNTTVKQEVMEATCGGSNEVGAEENQVEADEEYILPDVNYNIRVKREDMEGTADSGNELKTEENQLEARNENRPVCRVCDKSFSNRGNLNHHISSIHQGKKPYQCHVCGKGFSETAGLKMHIASVHLGEKPHQCCDCGKRFGKSSSLKIHMRGVHGGEMKVCQVCGASIRFHMLNTHVKEVHQKVKPHTCGVCGKAFTRPSRMKMHMKIHKEI